MSVLRKYFIFTATQLVVLVLPLFLLICLAAIGQGQQPPLPFTPTIETSYGLLRGKIDLSPSGKKIYTFTGIPYALAPVEELRFRRPVSILKKWEDVLNATSLPNSCPQIPATYLNFEGENMWNPNTPISEDCLYLNIWVPEHVYHRRERELAKVLFWIYGGGYYSGTSTLALYDGKILAGEQDIIVVSAQYRVGPLGFLYLDHEEAPGNMGLLDQNLAIKWTHENIKGFGGDPGGITLFGESCGAVSVSYHLISPLSRPYFNQGILMSGVATAPFAYKSKKDVYDASVKLVKIVGCWEDDTDPAEIISCLRSLDHVKLSEALSEISDSKFLDLGLVPTIDDHFLTNDPATLLTDEMNAKRTKLIIGNVKDEGSYFLVYPNLSQYKKFSHLKSSPISQEFFVTIMNEVFRDRTAAERDAIITYYTNWEFLEAGLINTQRIVDVIGDAYFTCPGREWADKWAARGLDVYFYYFTERTSSNPWGEWLGVLHGDEIEYVFGFPLPHRQKYKPAEMMLSVKMMELWANFAKTGVPSKGWSPYTKNKPFYLNLNSSTISDSTPATRNVFGPRPSACAFWNVYLPKLRQRLEGQPSNRSSNENFNRNSLTFLLIFGINCTIMFLAIRETF